LEDNTWKISEQVHAEKHRQKGETHKESCARVASALKDSDEHFAHFKDILVERRFLTGGRVHSSVGATRTTTAFNCFVMSTIPDSMEGITSVLAEAAQTLRMGGGVGYDFSTLRPRHDIVKSLDSSSSGPVSFMGVFDALCATISSAGHRRGAQMATLRVDHPDIEEYVTAKNNFDRLTNFNISVLITDEFMECALNDKPFDLRFDGRVYRTINAKNLLDTILRSNWDWAEPGVLFIDRINSKNNLWYIEKIASTNPCKADYCMA